MSVVARLLRTWTWVHAASLAVVFVVLTLVCRGQWFFGDEWDFLAFRGLHHPVWTIWYPHNEHWSTLPILWYRAVFSLFGLKTYWPYLFGLFAVHLVVTHALWRVMRRVHVHPPLATGLALVFGLYGAGHENLTWAFQIGFVGSLAAGLLLVLAVDTVGAPRRVALVAAGAVVSLLFSGISVVAVGALGIAALARWGWRKALAATAPAAAVYLGWLAIDGRKGIEGSTSQFHGGIGDIPRFAWGGVSTTLGRPFGNDRIGEALLVVLVAVVVFRARAWWRSGPDALALAVAAPVMFAVIAQGRGALQDPRAPRYLYLAAAMLLPLIALAVQLAVRAVPWRVGLALVGCGALVVAGTRQLQDAAQLERARELTLQGGILTALAVAPGLRTVSDRPDFAFAGDLTLAQLRKLQRDGRLPRITPTVADIAYAHLALQVGITRAGVRPSRVTAAAALPAGASADRRADCTRVDLRGANAVITRTADVTTFSVTSDVPGRISAFVPYTGGNAGGRSVDVVAGERLSYVDVLDEPLVLQLPGPATICGVTWTHG